MRRGVWCTALAVFVLGAGVCVANVSVPAAAASPAPLTIALVTPETGPGSPQYTGDTAGFIARIKLQNAEGGVHGHKLVPLVIDDQTTSTPTAVGDAIAKNAIGIVAESPLFYGAAHIAQQQGVPVTGSYSDGPEWGKQPYTNMFASDEGSLNPSYPENTMEAKVIREFGGTVLGSYGYSGQISPTSNQQATQVGKSFEHVGGSLGVLDTSVPFGATNFTGIALTAKQHGVNAIFPTIEDAAAYTLAQAMEQAGVKLKTAVFATGPDPKLITSPEWQSLHGAAFLSLYRPFQLPNAATEQMAAALQKYAGFKKAQFPTLFQYETWAGADLMIRGLQMAGSNPTHAGVIKALRSIRDYTANGLLPNPINYSTIFGHDLPQTCVWVLRAEADSFVATSSQPVCGTDIKGTSYTPSS